MAGESRAAVAELERLLASLAQECIVRVRRGPRLWESSNRAGQALPAGPSLTRAFRSASVTKTFTAALLLLLCEERALALDEPLGAYLEPALLERIHVYRGKSYGAGITLGQLLAHRSGLFDYATSADFFRRVAASPSRRWSPLELLEVAIEAGSASFAPGEGLAYGDTAYVLLGLVLEKVGGTPLASLYRRRLLEPLGLTLTYLEGREAAADWPVAAAFAGELDTSGFDPSFDTFGGGGLVSTAADLDRFISALLGGRIYAQPGTLALMLQGVEAPPGVGTRKIRSASGISEFAIADQRFWGHLGHWNSFMLHCAERDISICGSFNQAEADPRQKQVHEAALRLALAW